MNRDFLRFCFADVFLCLFIVLVLTEQLVRFHAQRRVWSRIIIGYVFISFSSCSVLVIGAFIWICVSSFEQTVCFRRPLSLHVGVWRCEGRRLLILTGCQLFGFWKMTLVHVTNKLCCFYARGLVVFGRVSWHFRFLMISRDIGYFINNWCSCTRPTSLLI